MRALIVLLLLLPATVLASTGVHTTYLWHMHQPIYWPDESTWNPGRYETVYETITLGHSQNDEFTIFNSDDRVGDYQWYPRDAVSSISDLPEAGAQVSFAGALMENLFSLGDAGWNGGRYASDWYSHYRQARSWPNSAGKPRLEPVIVGFHHAIGPLMDENAFRMELACAKAIYDDAWGDSNYSAGFFPAEMCFSERLIPALADAGIAWSIVPDLHIARACANYPFTGHSDNCDPPNPADQINPAQAQYTAHFISRGVTLKVPYPYGFTPHRAQQVDPATGAVSEIIVVPAANAMGWDEGYGLFGTGPVDAIAGANDPARPMLVLFAHDGDNAWSGGHSYYYENVTGFSHAAAANGHTPTTVATYLAHHPVPADDIVHVEDGGWVNADGDFGSPQYINWNWPPVDSSGNFDIPAGWAEDERNWAVLTAAQNVVETAEQVHGAVPDPERVVNPLLGGATEVERAWHFLLAGYESGYMYYGSSLDMEVKATLACNEALESALPVAQGGADLTAPTVWLPQRLPWNPGGFGAGSLWGYPGGQGEPMTSDFHVWTFAHDLSGLARVELMIREDVDGTNDPDTHDNELYAGGPDVGAPTALAMNHRVMPLDEPWPMGGIDFTELPERIADQYWIHLTGYDQVLLDYWIEAEDAHGNVKRSPIQHVWVGEGGASGGFVMDGALDDSAEPLAVGGALTLWGKRDGDLLYVATEAAGGGSDRFLMVCEDTLGVGGAPWAKAGDCVPWSWYLAAEESNGWSGWFDAAEAVQSGGAFANAQGAVLEGVLDLDALFAGNPPSTLWLAAAGYASPDGGALTAQAPTGNADGNLDPPEYYELSDATPAPVAPAAFALRAHPNPFNPSCRLAFTLPRAGNVSLKVFGVNGREVATLIDGVHPGGLREITWNAEGMPSGVYLAKLEIGGVADTERLVLLK